VRRAAPTQQAAPLLHEGHDLGGEVEKVVSPRKTRDHESPPLAPPPNKCDKATATPTSSPDEVGGKRTRRIEGSAHSVSGRATSAGAPELAPMLTAAIDST